MSHALKMLANESHCYAALLSESTSYAKSCVLETISVVEHGVTFIIKQTLCLNSDQSSKFDEVSSSKG